MKYSFVSAVAVNKKGSKNKKNLVLPAHQPPKIIAKTLEKQAATLFSIKVIRCFTYFIKVFLNIFSCLKCLQNVGFSTNKNEWRPSTTFSIHAWIDCDFEGYVSILRRLIEFYFIYSKRLLLSVWWKRVSWLQRFECPFLKQRPFGRSQGMWFSKEEK